MEHHGRAASTSTEIRTVLNRAAFLDGVLWNTVNIAIVAWLLLRVLRRIEKIAPAAAHLPPR